MTTLKRFLTLFFVAFLTVNMWGTDVTYTFASKSWTATSGGAAANWTSGTDGAGYNNGVQVTTGASGANATSPSSLTDISKIVVHYHTNKNAGVGTIKVKVGSGAEKSFSVTKPATDAGLTSKSTTFNFSPVETGKVLLTVNCTTNSVYIESIDITYGSSTATVAYNANGGSGSMTSQTGSASYTVKSNGFTAPSGGTFTGWNTAADGSGTAYAAGATISTSATLFAQWKYSVRFYTASGTYTTKTETSAHNGVTPPDMEATCGDYTFYGWSKTERTSDVTTATTCVDLTAGKFYPTDGTTYQLYPIYIKYVGGSNKEDVLNQALTGITGTSYTDFSGLSDASSARYAGQCAGSNSSIQLRATSPSGVVTTTSGGNAKKVTIVWESHTAADRTLQIYGKNTAYSTGADLYSADASVQGTLLGNIVKGTSTELSITGDYAYIGLRSSDGAMYLTSVTIQWATGTPHYYSYPTCVTCTTPTLDFAEVAITKYVGDAPFTAAFTGTNPGSGAITYTSSNTTCADVNSSTGEVTIKRSTIDGSPVTITAYLAAAGSDPCYKAKVMTYTIDIKNRITWIANEVATTAGLPTTEANFNGTIDAIPTNPAVPSACSTKSFVGWTTIADWNSDDAPDPLYTSLSDFSSLKIQENKTFYAVFADTESGDPESTLTQTMQYDTWTYSGSTSNKSAQKYRLFGDDAYIQSESNVNWANLSQVIVYGGYFGDSECTGISIRKADGSTTWLNGDVSGNSQTKANTFSGGASLTGSSKMRVYVDAALCDGSSSGVRISKVEIYEMVATTVGTAYVTKCCNDWTDPTLTYDKYSLEVGEADATKSLSGTTHGTLSFSSSNTSIATVDPSTGAVHAVSPGNVTITANWTKQDAWCAKSMPINFTITGDVTITFDANGGTGSMASQVVSYATATSLNSMSGLTAPDGKTFIGWNTQANGKGTAYANGGNIKLTTNTTLYAQWGTSYTITLHRSGNTQTINVLSTDFPYELPKGESDYCDAWQFDGWSASAVANNSDLYTKVAKAITPENADFYAVYRGAPYSADAYVRIDKADDIEANKQYIFVAYVGGKKNVMTNTFSRADYDYGEMTTLELAESGKGYYLKSVIDTDHPQCRWKITGSTGSWRIFNMSSSTYCINLYYASDKTWYTTSTTSNTYKITPNYLFWTVESNASVTYKYLNASKQGSEPNVRYVFQTSKNHSGALQIYKLGTTEAYKYTSTPSGEGCAQSCTDCGAQFTYPAMDKSISSKPFNNPIVYSGAPNNASKAYSSSNEGVAEVDPATGEVTVKGIGEVTITMTQLRDNTDPSHPVCGITISYDITVTSPSLEVVEVTGDDKIIVEHDFDGITKAEVDSSKLDIKGTIADDIFISKYYEAASEMKLIGLYNGTLEPIDLSKLRIRTPGKVSKTDPTTIWGGSDHHGEAYLGNIAKLGEDYPDYMLPPFTEIVLWSNKESGDNNGGNAQLCYCVNMEVDKKKYNYDDMLAGNVPNWYRIGTTSGGTDLEGNKTFNFNGDDAIILERSTDNWSTWTAIDLFGAGTPEAPVADPTGSGNGYVQKKSFNDNPGGWYWDATSAAGKELSTNRFYLTRLSTVKSGWDAVEKNATSFATLEDEWKGEGIGSGTNMEDYCGSGELFSEVATYDFAKYYTDYVEYKDKFTASDNGDGTFTLQFNPGELEKLSCKKIKISVQDALDNTKTAEVEYRVPIIVTSGSSTTTDALFNKHDKDECKICDVAILDGAVLTKSKPSTPAEVAADREQMYNIDVYSGGELYIPTGTTYNINTLTVRSKGDAVGVVDVQGKLTRNNTTLIHYKRFHNEGADWRWYYFSLPYDCDVSTVTYSNGDPAVHGVDFQIDWYDGEHRASSQANGNWRSIATHPEYPNTIKAGYGYTIAVEEKSGHKNVSLLFPMANFIEPTQVPVTVGNWGAGDDGVEVNHKGWNVVGNPFLTRYKAQEDLDINGELRTGELVYAGGGWTQTPNGVNYATVPQNGGQSGYTQEALTNHNFNPFQSFIIQVGGDAERNDLAVQLKNAYKYKHPYSIVMRKASEYETGETTPVWLRLNLSNTNEETDQTTILISDNYTAEYDMQRDLAKWRGTDYKFYTRPVLSSVYGGHELAFNALPDSIVADRVPLTYYSRNAGKMAFELSSAYNWKALEEVILHDVVMETQHNLLTNGKYEFNSNAGEISNRFYISAKVNRRKTPAIATSVDLVDMKNVQLTVQERTIHINGLEPGTQVYIFDMSGRLVGRQVATIAYMNFNVPAFGVYNIRLIGQKAGTTLRALVHQ